ncbi:MAG: cytochrome c family protein [Chromatiales bacterium]|nr:cytochrome c family protein [Chromatiales bacterium]
MLKGKRSIFSVPALALLVSACSPGEPPQMPAGMDVDDYDIDALVAAADPNRGRTQFILCQSCHSLSEGGPHKVGPNLWGFFGNQAAQAPGFNFSNALRESGIVWTNETLDAFIERPSDLVPGNSMVFVGIRNPLDRAAIIAYLKQETGAE